MYAIRPASSRWSSPTAPSHACSRQRASCGDTAPPLSSSPRRWSPSLSRRWAIRSTVAGFGWAAVGVSWPPRPSARAASAIAACAHFAALPCAPPALTRPARKCARNSRRRARRRRLRPRASDVDSRVVVRAADPGAVERRDVCRRRAVELAARGRRCAPPRRRTAVPGDGGVAPSAARRRGSRGARARTRSRARTCSAAHSSTSSRCACSHSWSSGVIPKQSTCTACASPRKLAVSSSEMNTSGRSAISSTPAIVSWSVIVTRSMPRRLASS